MKKVGSILIMLIFTVGCGSQDDGQVELMAPQAPAIAKDSRLMQAHALLRQARVVGDCKVQTFLSSNGRYQSLHLAFGSRTDDLRKSEHRLEFRTSGHITSKVKVKYFLFSSIVKEILFEKIDISSVPLTRKDRLRVRFSKPAVVTSIEHQVFVGSQWNVTDETICN